MVTETAQYSALHCFFNFKQNDEYLLISNTLRFICSILLAIAFYFILHIARHSFANIARQKNANVYDISKALGHSNLKITETYLAKFDTTSQDATMKQVFQNNTKIDENTLLKQLQSLTPEALASLLAKVNK